ncbi:carbohydrate ABC transporter permease [Nonomuraea soli]|uniref:Multiple sugar transport system permease protein n=1 Tax=Nonomuraea soli TaxID=1032476 RepID=A0A7W0HSI9_9ACTN|nr:sugar ABC transporter permease [Nonomuraea soli]MBA2893711.1 multiple sugar transport system permease protein [Nonomuraea soli]
MSLSARYARTAYLFLLPALVFFTAFFYVPIANVIATSLHTGPQADVFAGLSNYADALADPSVRHSFLVTLGFSGGVVAGSLVFGLLLALVLDQPLKGRVTFRAMLLVPYLTSVAIVGLLWRNILDPQLGILNRLGLDQQWLNEHPLATIVGVTLWQTVGYTMVLFLAGLQGIPETYQEAARIDGASAWQRFWRITLPLLAPTTLFVSVMAVISGLQAFGQAYIITNGGPGDATDLSVFHIYATAFKTRDFGYSSAQSVLLLVVIVLFTLMQLRAGKRGEVTY